MKRVVVFQGLGVAEPRAPLPDGVWQRGKPSPSLDQAIWYRTDAIEQRTQFPQTYPTPAVNCRMCPPEDNSPDCCHYSSNMPMYRNFAKQAYSSAYKPWNYDSWAYQTPPNTSDMVAFAMQESLRQAKLEMAPVDMSPPDPNVTLSGFLNGGSQGLGSAQGQTHLLGLGAGGQGQTHLLGLGHYTPRYSLFGNASCSSCAGQKLGGYLVSSGLGGMGTVLVAGAVSTVVSLIGLGFWIAKGKKAATTAKVATFALPVTAAVLAADMTLIKSP